MAETENAFDTTFSLIVAPLLCGEEGIDWEETISTIRGEMEESDTPDSVYDLDMLATLSDQLDNDENCPVLKGEICRLAVKYSVRLES